MVGKKPQTNQYFLKAQNALMESPEFEKMFEFMGQGNDQNPFTIARTMLMMWNVPKEQGLDFTAV